MALVLEEFGRVVPRAGQASSSPAWPGHLVAPLDAEQEQALAHTPADELLDLPPGDSRNSTFVSGTDLLVDGGVVAALRAGTPVPPA